MTDSISIHISGDFDLSPTDMFPDGIPDDWDGATIAALGAAEGSVGKLMREWFLEDLDVSVHVARSNPHWQPGEPLFGDRPERWLRENHRVFVAGHLADEWTSS